MAKNHKDVEDFYKICTVKSDEIIAPCLYSKNKTGSIQIWQISVRVVDVDGKPVQIDPAWIAYETRLGIPADYVGQYYTRFGQLRGKIQTSDPYSIKIGKNIGRKNETSVFTQTMADALSDYRRKIREGYKTDQTMLDSSSERPFIMAFTDRTNSQEKIVYPCYVQRKLDGIMVVIDVAKAECYSRTRETYNLRYLEDDLSRIRQYFPNRKLYLTGEYYQHGVRLQELSGNIRKKDGVIPRSIFIFDCFDVNHPELIVPDRLVILDKIPESEYIKKLESVLCQTPEDLTREYNKFISEGYEGLMYRPVDSTYEFSIHKEYRSFRCGKVKPRSDGEWPVIGFELGNGRDKDAIIWQCGHNDLSFTVVPNMPIEARTILGKYFTENRPEFDARIRGQQLTIDYSILSSDGLPQQPKALRFRDPETETYLSEILDSRVNAN